MLGVFMCSLYACVCVSLSLPYLTVLMPRPGDYMVVFGGYTHRHRRENVCYDHQMFFYNLRCHTWVNHGVLEMTSDCE